MSSDDPEALIRSILKLALAEAPTRSRFKQSAADIDQALAQERLARAARKSKPAHVAPKPTPNSTGFSAADAFSISKTFSKSKARKRPWLARQK